MRTRAQRGFSLLELAMVLALASVVVGVTINYVVSAKATNSARNLRNELGVITNLAAEQLATGTPRANVTTASLWANPGIPATIKRPAGVLANSAGGAIGVSAVTAAVSGWPETQISFAAVSSAQCVQLIQASAARYDEIYVVGAAAAVKNTTGNVGQDATAATIAAACNTASRSTINFRIVK